VQTLKCDADRGKPLLYRSFSSQYLIAKQLVAGASPVLSSDSIGAGVWRKASFKQTNGYSRTNILIAPKSDSAI